MKLFDYFSKYFGTNKTLIRTIQELEKKVAQRGGKIHELEEILRIKNIEIKALERKVKAFETNRHQYYEDRQTDTYVLDASFCGCENFDEEFNKIIESGKRIILTSITIRELKKLRNGLNKPSMFTAKKILDYSLLNSEKFIFETINQRDTPDDSIIEFCYEHRKNVELLTCDKEMALLAQAAGIKVQFFKPPYNECVSLKSLVDLSSENCITSFEYPDKSVMVRSHTDGKTISFGEYRLIPGDDIFIIYDNKYYYHFSHYRIPSKKPNYAMLVYDVLIWSKEDVECLSHKDYRRFVKNYLSKKTQESS